MARHLTGSFSCAKAASGKDLRPGLSFLNVGSGTGYLSALAHELLGPTSVHVGLERHPSLVARARASCASAKNVVFEVGDLYDVDVTAAPRFDRIYVGAGARADARRAVLRRLKPGGVGVGPFEDRDRRRPRRRSAPRRPRATGGHTHWVP